MRHRPHVQTQTRFVQNEPGEEQHQQYKAEHHNTVPGQRQVGENLHPAGQPGRVSDLKVLGAKGHADQLDKHQADPPGGEQGFQRAAIQMADHRALQHHPDTCRQAKRHRQRHHRIERQPLRHPLRHNLLHHPGGIRPEHQHFAVGHVNHPQQTIGDSQPERGQQEYRSQRQAHEGLPQQFAPHQPVLNTVQALSGGGTYPCVRLGLRPGEWRQRGLHVRIVRLSQQFNRVKARFRLRTRQLKICQRQPQRLSGDVVRFAISPLLQKPEHIRLGVTLKLPRGMTPFGDTVTDKLMRRQRRDG